MNLNDRDKDLLNALTTRVRLFTAEQSSRLLWPGGTTPLALVRRRLRALCEAHLLEERPILAEPLLALRAPIVAWSAGDRAPDFHAVAWRLQSRWTETARETVVYIATEFAADTFGGVAARLPPVSMLTRRAGCHESGSSSSTEARGIKTRCSANCLLPISAFYPMMMRPEAGRR